MGKPATDMLTFANLTQNSESGSRMLPYLRHTDACAANKSAICDCGLAGAAGHAPRGRLVEALRTWADHAEDCAGAKNAKAVCTCNYTAYFGKKKA